MKNSDVKFGICQNCLPVEGPYACKIAADLGLEGIELNFARDMADEPLTRKYVQAAYLQAGKDWGVAFPSLAVNLLGKYGMSKTAHAETAKAVIDAAIGIACKMSIPILQFPSFGAGEIFTDEDFQRTVMMLKHACYNAKSEGIIIGSENTLSWQDNLRLLNETGSENLKIYFDTQNPYVFKGYDAAEMVEALGSLICGLHAKDGRDGKMGSACLGEGEAGFYKTVESLKRVRYKGWIQLENDYFNPSVGFENESQAIKRDISTLQNAFGISGSCIALLQ